MGSILNRAALIRAPHGNGATGTTRDVHTQAVSSASTSAVAVDMGDTETPQYVTFVCTEDAYIRFGRSDVGAATTSDWPLRADEPQTFVCHPREDDYFRIIRGGSTDGTLHWYRSS